MSKEGEVLFYLSFYVRTLAELVALGGSERGPLHGADEVFLLPIGAPEAAVRHEPLRLGHPLAKSGPAKCEV